MKKIIFLIASTICILAIAWILIKPIAYCLLAGMLIGAIVWAIENLFRKE